MKRFAFRFAIVLLAGLVALPAGLDAGLDAGARKGRGKGKGGGDTPATQVVTRAFDNAGAIAVPATGTNGAAAPYPVPITVSGLGQGKVVDVDLTLRVFSHAAPDDVDLLLVAPGGRNAIVMGDAGGNPDVTNLTLTLDDEAAAALPDETALAAGSFRPANQSGAPESFPAPAPAPGGAVALSTFDGIDANGTWSLFVVDDTPIDTGSIAGGWTLTVTAEVSAGGKGDGKGKGKGKGDGKGKYDGKGGKGGGKGRGR